MGVIVLSLSPSLLLNSRAAKVSTPARDCSAPMTTGWHLAGIMTMNICCCPALHTSLKGQIQSKAQLKSHSMRISLPNPQRFIDGCVGNFQAKICCMLYCIVFLSFKVLQAAEHSLLHIHDVLSSLYGKGVCLVSALVGTQDGTL